MYKIVITKTEPVAITKRGDWTTIDVRPYTDAEVAEANKVWQADPELAKKLKEVKGYTPDRPTIQEVEVEVYKQVVAEMDLFAVIQAANKQD